MLINDRPFGYGSQLLKYLLHCLQFFLISDMSDNKNFRRSSKSSYDKKKETDEDDREDEELDWSHTVCLT